MFNATKTAEVPALAQTRGGHDAQTMIARGVRVEGDLVSQGNVVIDGEVQGSIQCAGQLFVGPEAKVTANVNAQEAVISGSVEGNIVVGKRLDVKATARLNGDIQAETASVEIGAAIAGRLTVGAKQQAQQTRSATAVSRREMRPAVQPVAVDG